ncbi:MAG: GntR family transcriptional regulator [Acidisphaera sp.]|nr:GntR family transcriptional regulator [Acidisphaera sp.]MBV9811451.1 GntR family transcriptional regulator [Acetobacteraceae bacterium]
MSGAIDGSLLRGADIQYRRVAARLRADIISGLWKSDARLKVRDLAAHYGVSPAPIRESLQQLQGEGLVVMLPNRGARVRRIDETLIINIFDVREALEGFLTAKFAAAASPHQVALLEQMQEEHDDAVEAGDYPAAFLVNGRFHQTINGGARNPEAVAVIERHLTLTRALRLECGFSEKRMRAIQNEHRQLIAAIRDGDAQSAGRIAGLHVRSSRDDLLERLQSSL